MAFEVALKMNKQVVIDKLKNFLNKHPIFSEECEVIYLMVQIRKILDFKDSKYSYDTLRFYCNWVLHIKLNKEMTTNLLSNMLEPAVDSRKSGHDNARNIINLYSDFFKLNTLKKELEIFIKEYSLLWNLSNKIWWKFARLLLEVISNCQVYFKSTVISKLEPVKADNGEFGYKLSLVSSREKPVIKLKLKPK